MNAKQKKWQRGVKSKLLAAVSMLLVSCILMVSSTYAWFTLSTAPEVTGITTAVGANGNLEIALVQISTSDGNVTVSSVPETGVGDGASTKTQQERNLTWGNLVDVTDGYGLDSITLLPSELHLDDNGKISITNGILSYPQYGSDGRITGLTSGTDAFSYTSGTGFVTSELTNGVRGVGVNAGLTPRQLAFRNAVSAVNSNTNSAIAAAKVALENEGQSLANIAVKLGLSSGADTYSAADVDSLINMATSLQTALEKIDLAYVQYILAYSASSNVTSDAVYQTVQGWIEDDKVTTLTDMLEKISGASDDFGMTLPTDMELSTVAVALDATKTAVNTALTELTNIKASEGYTNDTVTWEDLKTPLYRLADVDKMTVNGFTVTQLKNNETVDGEACRDTIINQVIDGTGVKVNMNDGAGAFADVAQHTGTYSANITVTINYQGQNLKNVKTTITATCTTSGKLVTLYNGIKSQSPSSTSDTALPLSDMYGYIIDMAFRTNATGSQLILQKTATDRIYSDNSNEDTMGGGASMTFSSATMSNDAIKSLMKCIKIVFFSPDDGSIIAYARLDTDNATSGVDGLTAYLQVYTVEKVTTYTYTKEGSEDVSVTTALSADQLTEGTYAGYTLSSTTIEEKKTDVSDNTIMTLEANTQTNLSVLVYLDGNEVKNADVAASGTASVTGSLNLQFSSSADLTPMDYSGLHTGNGSSAAEDSAENGNP